ncbi:MAG: LuxR C-terminal-related transcriptional regulator [Mycetocola sp.]
MTVEKDPALPLRDAVTTGDPQLIAQVAMDHIWPLFNLRYAELTEAIEAIPRTVLDEFPLLSVLHRVNPILAHRRRPLRLRIDPDALRIMSPDEVDMITLSQMIATCHNGDVTTALTFAKRLSDRITLTGTELRQRPDGPLWFFHEQIGSTLLAAGDTGQALVELGTANQLAVIAERDDIERLTLGRMALAHAKRGSFDEAERLLADLAPLPLPGAPYRESSESSERTAAALMSVERMTPDADIDLADLDPFGGFQTTWAFALLARTRYFLATQRPDDALEAVNMARDAHAEQRGSLAADVMNSTSIDALWALGARNQARTSAYHAQRRGFLETGAAIRLGIADENFDFADQQLRVLDERQHLAPAQHTERVLLSAWLSIARTGAVDPATAQQVARIVLRGNSRRALSQIPLPALTEILSGLTEDTRVECAAALTGLSHVLVQSRPRLTKGERRVLHTLRRHLTTAEIAAHLHVSPNTVKTQLSSIYRKLACANRSEAIQVATSFQLISAEDGDAA